MTSPRCPGPDAERSRRRATVASAERELSLLPRQEATDDGKGTTSAHAASWADLVGQLALSPDLEVRECPICSHIGLRAVTICAYCCKKLTAPAGLDGAVG
ncbi:MAG: hypothetical protein HY901_26530 [Deltaproteobacteria bacterium]|nr:hypothetical protein [Deltaproteobacteria bacterium]